jgi:hypothetical protein
MKYPRYTGERIVYTPLDLVDYINLYNGKKTCKISLYSFEDSYNDVPDVETIIIDSLLFINDLEHITELHKFCISRELVHSILYDGNYLQCIVYLEKDIMKRDLPVSIQECDSNNEADIFIVYPNTWNTRHRRYCVPLNTDDLKDMKTIIEKAQEPNKNYVKDWEETTYYMVK